MTNDRTNLKWEDLQFSLFCSLPYLPSFPPPPTRLLPWIGDLGLKSHDCKIMYTHRYTKSEHRLTVNVPF